MVNEQDRVGPFFRTFLVTPINLGQLKRFIVRRWPEAGYRLGRGDSEAGEIEDHFSKGPASGVFFGYRHCEPGKSVLNLIYRKRGTALPQLKHFGKPLVPKKKKN